MSKCRHCGRPLGNLNIFCRVCYDALPHKERSSLLGMWRRKENLNSKIAKCCRILSDQKKAAMGAEMVADIEARGLAIVPRPVPIKREEV